jgi:hypothetical protein
VDFPKERRSQDGELSNNERKTQPKMADFSEAKKRKTQPKWRTFTHEKKDTAKVGGLSERKTQPRWWTLK